MSSLRHRARQIAFQILYRYDVNHISSGTPPPEGYALADDLVRHFDHFAVQPEIREFSARLVTDTLLNMKSLDQKIEKHASNWKISRLGMVDRCVLRLAICELERMPETPPNVVIDEAIELAKEFGTADSPAFVNGVLDAVRKSQ